MFLVSILSISAINVVENTTNKDVIGTDNNKYFLKPYMEILSVFDWILKSLVQNRKVYILLSPYKLYYILF